MRRTTAFLIAVAALPVTVGCEIVGGIEARHLAPGDAGASGGSAGAGGDDGTGAGGGAGAGGNSCSQSGCPSWSLTFGGASFDFVAGSAADAAGNTLLTGTFQAELTFNGIHYVPHGVGDIFAAKVGPSGEPLWLRPFGDDGDQATGNWGGIGADDAGNAYFGGNLLGNVSFGGDLISATASRGYLVKLGPDGSHEASVPIGDGSVDLRLREVSVGATGNRVAVSGHFGGALDVNGMQWANNQGAADAYVVALDGQLAVEWAHTFNSAAGDVYGASVLVAPSGDVYVGGSTLGVLDEDPNASYGGMRDAYVAKLDGANGTLLWLRAFGDATPQEVTALAADSQGGLYVAGKNAGVVDVDGQVIKQGVFLLAFDGSTGTAIDAVTYLTGAEADGLVVDGAGNVYLGCQFQGSLDFGGGPLNAAGGKDIGIVKLDNQLNHVWSRALGGNGEEILSHGLALSSDGGLLAAGHFESDLPLDVPHTSEGLFDVFVVHLEP